MAGVNLLEKYGNKPVNLLEKYGQPENHESFLQRHLINPIKGAKGKNALETAGNLADLLINKPIEMTGLPSFARGAFQSGENIIRGVGNVPADIAEYTGHEINPKSIPGIGQVYPIPRTEFPRPQNVNPYLGEAAEDVGSLLGLGAVNKIYQGGKQALNALPYAKNIPNFAKNILAGAGTGAAVSPDNRELGGVLGGGLTAVGEAIPAATNTFNKLKPKAFEAIQEGYDTKLKKAGDIFKSVSRIAERKDLNNIPLRQGIIDEIKEFGPKKKSFTRLIDQIKDGNYEALRKAQSELFKRAEKAKSSDLISEQDLGDKLYDLRDEINESIFTHFTNKGLPKLAERLKRGMSQYKQLIDVYHSHPQIAKLVGENRLTPQNSKVLRENSERMKRLKQEHPEIEKQLSLERKIKTAAGLLGGSAILGEAKHLIGG
jgi:hypothetical protein